MVVFQRRSSGQDHVRHRMWLPEDGSGGLLGTASARPVIGGRGEVAVDLEHESGSGQAM